MADQDTVTPIQSPSTDHPDAPQSSMTMPSMSSGQPVQPQQPQQYTEGSQVQDAQGNRLRLHNNEWMPVFDQKNLVKNAQGQTLGLDPRTNKWVDVTTGKPYEAAPAGGAGGSYGEDSMATKIKDIAADAIKGVGMGGATTVANAAHDVNQVAPGAGKAMGADAWDNPAMKASITPQNTAQRTGFGAEALLEMMQGEGVLKGMSLTERLGFGAKLAKMADDYPIIAKILAHGLDAVRMGSAQAGVNVAKGQPVGQALAAGAETAAVGTGVGALAEGAGAAATHMFNPETGTITRMANQIRQGEGVAQKPAQAAMATAAGEQGSSVRELLTNPINRAKSVAKSGYDQIEQATGVDLKTIQQKLDNTVEEINKLTGTEADIAKEAQLEKARTELMDQVDEAKKMATSKGVPADAIEKADAAWKQHKALSEVQGMVFDNEGVISGNTAHGSPEKVNVDNAIRNLEKLNNKTKYGAPRLQEAFGASGADRLMKEMYAAQREGVKAMSVQKWTKLVGKIAGIGTAGAVAGHVLE